jgi:hypothetical protein
MRTILCFLCHGTSRKRRQLGQIRSGLPKKEGRKTQKGKTPREKYDIRALVRRGITTPQEYLASKVTDPHGQMTFLTVTHITGAYVF